MSSLIVQKFQGDEITSAMLSAAATLFSDNYGIWGALAAEKMGPFAKRGGRVKMSVKKLREQILPTASSETSENTYVRALLDDKLVGNVFATRWTFEGRELLWITQLCVSASHRNQGIAKNLLQVLREDDRPTGCGILSSQPFAISAVLRVFGRGLEDVDLTMTKHHGRAIMDSSPVKYVREAKLRGGLFEGTIDGTEANRIVCCADTGFWVDHSEPEEALKAVRGKGIAWPFGDLPEGHEFLVIVEVKATAFGRDSYSSAEIWR